MLKGVECRGHPFRWKDEGLETKSRKIDEHKWYAIQMPSQMG